MTDTNITNNDPNKQNIPSLSNIQPLPNIPNIQSISNLLTLSELQQLSMSVSGLYTTILSILIIGIIVYIIYLINKYVVKNNFKGPNLLPNIPQYINGLSLTGTLFIIFGIFLESAAYVSQISNQNESSEQLKNRYSCLIVAAAFILIGILFNIICIIGAISNGCNIIVFAISD